MDWVTMDNINVIRVGFFAPQVSLTDTEMRVDDPVKRSGNAYTCLVFINADESGAKIVAALEKGLPEDIGEIVWNLSVVVPVKPVVATEFKRGHGLRCRIFCDGELTAGKSYCIVDSQSARPAYHPTIFAVGDEGSVRFRQSLENEAFEIDKFRESIAAII